MHVSTITHFHIFCGAGGGAIGFQRGEARVGALRARFDCLGGIDSDPAACRDFSRLVGVSAACLDLFSREQYEAFHGRRPPEEWHETTPDDVRRAAQGKVPDILFLSAPCKGFSGLLSAARASSPKYEALNALALRGLLLAMEAWGDDPPPLVLFENVPRIQQRGRALLDRILGMLRHYGYAARETTHDAGELGGLAQHRNRFLLVARHEQKVPSFLYEPSRRRVRAIGEVLSELPVPGAPAAGPLHAMPRLTWLTWLRLALIPAGKDWRALQGLDLGAYGLVRYGDHHGKMRVEDWTEAAHTITGSDRVGSGALSIADVRWGSYGQYGVMPMDAPSGTVTGQAAPGSGRFSIADPKWGGGTLGVLKMSAPSGTIAGESYPTNGRFSVADARWRKGTMGVLPLDASSGTITGRSQPSMGAFSVAAKVPAFNNIYRLIKWDEPSACVTGGASTGGGGLSVADPRASWSNAGHYGVVRWDSPAGAVTAAAQHDNGRHNVADPRDCQIAQFDKDSPPIIVSLDGTWHRPLTTLELAALQGFPVDGLILDGSSHGAWRERIGNAIPPPAAQAIAGVMGQVLLMARSGQTFALSSTPIWVRPVALALTLAGPDSDA
jgi:site-specific DNA-cytosine methylase